ncbi:MAG TPA: DUF4139 domain-containing protein [Tepidisphaeraceae bacterium]|nr:DUF4139 domain-containing protein [Tepidisphaeraceae bacterium]
MTALAVIALSSTLMAQVEPTERAANAPTEIPVTHVSLFSSGVGFFEHSGSVSGTSTSVLNFQTDQINDVLKSLLLQDLDGGQIGTVTYPANDPLGRTLRGFQVDLSQSPTISGLLSQLRGSELSVTVQGETITGTILGIEGRKRAAGETTIDYVVVNLVTSAGIRSIAIDDAQKMSLTDPKLQEELNKALAAMSAARNNDKKNVTIDFKGDGDRRVRVGYVVETPVWKTSYRLMMGDAANAESKSNLQGWAIVENQTDTDWNNINLSLVSGRPLSFVMNLYDPMYLQRPEARLELFEGLTPQTYAEAREQVDMKKMARSARGAPAPAAMSSSFDNNDSAMLPTDDADGLEATEFKFSNASITAQASAGALGELFEYNVKDVTLARQSSAMIPIITDPIEVTRVSIFNQNVLARHPLSGARINNNTGKHLLQGPITVLDGTYAGDAQINNVPPGQTRLISYGIDLDVLVDADKTGNDASIQSGKIVKGVLEITNKNVYTHTFDIENKSDKAKTLVIEEPKRQQWKLIDSPKPIEETDAIYRFELKLEPKKAQQLVSKQQIITSQRLMMTNMDSDAMAMFMRDGAIPQSVKDALKKAIDLRNELVNFDRQLQANQQKLQEINNDQNRIRSNMNSVDRNSELYGRLLKKLDAQETQVDDLGNKNETLKELRAAKQAELDGYLSTLNVE